MQSYRNRTFVPMQHVVFKDLGRMDYQRAWDYQEGLLQENVRIKSEARQRDEDPALAVGAEKTGVYVEIDTKHYLLLVEHPPVYTLGKSGHMANVLIGDERMQER